MSSFHADLTIPDFMCDFDMPNQPHASRAVRQTHLDTALQPEYTLQDMLPLSMHNPGASDAMAVLIEQAPPAIDQPEFEVEALNLRNDAHMGSHGEVRTSSASDATTPKVLKKAFAKELQLSVAARIITQSCIPFFIICLSLLALKSGVPEDMWLMLQSMYVLANKDWVTKFASEAASMLRARMLQSSHFSTVVRFVVGDNCDYQTRNVHEHTDRSGEYLHTINWISVPLLKSLVHGVAAVRGAWKRAGFSRFAVRQRFNPDHPDIARLKRQTWRGFTEQNAAGDNILRHPDVPKPERTEVLLEEPLMDTGTASYKDVDRWLNKVKRLYIFLLGLMLPAEAPKEGASVVLAVGDQQTWSRMLWLKLYFPEKYAWLVPLPGEFHFTVHMLMAIHILWWPALVRFFVHKFKCFKTIKPVWSSVEQYKYYDHFYQLLILSFAQYLKEVVPAAILSKPDMLLSLVANNPAATYAVQFLFHFGYPWLALRQAIRSNHHRVIDIMWTIGYHWFGPTGKTNYRIMSVIVTYIRYAMIPPLAAVWTVMRTASLTGYAGFNVAWDFVLERFNRMCKQALGTNITRERICYYLPILNTFRLMTQTFAMDGSLSGVRDPEDNDNEAYEVESIRTMKGEGTKRKYLVKWKDHDEESWVKLADLKGAQELIDAFHAGRRVKRAKGNPDDDSGDDSSDGEDDDEVTYEVKQTRWWKDVSEILKSRAPRK